MSILFEVIDKSGRKIRLTKERWKHITQEHPDITDLEELKSILKSPLSIRPSKYDPDHVVWFYSHHNKTTKKYLLVAVKYLNGEGFIITSYYTRKIQ